MSGLKFRLPSGQTSLSADLLPAVASVLLLIALGAQFATSSGIELPKRAKAAAAQTGLPEQPVAQTFVAIMEHPIFAPDRAPPPLENEEAGNLSGVEVLGTAIAGKDRAAALLRDSEGTFQRVKVGGAIEGWTLVSIDRDQLVFDRNGERRSLSLDAAQLRAQNPDAKAKGQGATSSSSSTANSDTDDNDDNDDQ